MVRSFFGPGPHAASAALAGLIRKASHDWLAGWFFFFGWEDAWNFFLFVAIGDAILVHVFITLTLFKFLSFAPPRGGEG